MRRIQSLLLLSLLVALPAARAGGPARRDDPDAQLLQEAGVGSSDAEVLAFLNRQAESSLPRLAARVRQLGDDDYDRREEASRRLVAGGPRALRYLLPALHDKDAEIACRATACVAAINRHDRRAAPGAAARLLARRHPDGTAAALLRFLPCAVDRETEEQVWLALAALAVRHGKPDPLLLPALKDAEPARRALAACLLGHFGDAKARAAVCRLLDDADALVRLRVAQGLLAAREREALPALIGLLEAKPVAVAWQAEELLHWATGGTGPAELVGSGSAAEGKKCRAAWQGWWDKQGSRRAPADFGRGVRSPGLLLLADGREPDRVYLRGCDGTTRWQQKQTGRVYDLRLLDGDRVLLATNLTPAVIERDLGGKVVRDLKERGETCRQLPNGNTFIADNRHVAEVAPDGAVVYRTDRGDAWKLSNGLLATAGLCVQQFDPGSGKSVGPPRPLSGWTHYWRILDVRPDGGLLVGHGATLCAVDARYRSVWECRMDAASASQWLDGRTVATSFWQGGAALVELDTEGRRVWEEVSPSGPVLVRCCLPLLRVGFPGGPNPGEPNLDDPAVRAWGLRNVHALVRWHAALELRAMGRRSAIALPELLGACDDPDERVRAAVWAALADLAPQGRRAFAAALDDRRPAVRAAAAGLLALAGTAAELAGHVPALTKALEDRDVRVRLAAAATLAEVAPDEEGGLPVLRGALTDRVLPPASRGLAARALGRLGPRGVAALPALKRAADDLHAAPAAAEDWAAVVRAQALLRRIVAARDESAAVRANALRELGLQGSKADRAVPIVLERLRDRDPAVRRAAVECLGRLGAEPKVVVPALVAVLATPDDAPLHADAALVLGEIGPAAKAAVPALIALLKAAGDDEAAITRRSSAAWALAGIGAAARAARPALERAAGDDPSDRVRRQARYALGRIGGDR